MKEALGFARDSISLRVTVEAFQSDGREKSGRVSARPQRAGCTLQVRVSHRQWRGEKSDDGKTWSEFMVVEVYRVKG